MIQAILIITLLVLVSGFTYYAYQHPVFAKFIDISTKAFIVIYTIESYTKVVVNFINM